MHDHPPADRRVDDAPLLELDLRGLSSPDPMMRAVALPPAC
ncbi:MAG: hypothetical protein ABI343_10815 [Burkholderiaceae bacterium]